MKEESVWSQKAGSLPQAEPWLRGTMNDVKAVPRAVIHALELAKEDVHKWCGGLTDEELNTALFGLPSVGFHLRHISRSLDRLLTYAEGRPLSAEQMQALQTEATPDAARDTVFEEFSVALGSAVQRVLAIHGDLDEVRFVGKKQLPTTLGGLLVHVADHTQRHVGQVVTTGKLLRSITAD